MEDHVTQAILLASTVLAALAIVSMTAMRCWQGWLALKERELERGPRVPPELQNGSAIGVARIEIADLKERIRKLEAIASGVDL
ncbi:hypothetical protein [Qipengyuania sp. JC766]|uniref:hypothetical protein n=1 Tax=Qipengyuania sp. JC766 TaxID=3232139 RepID=UPI003457C50F